MIQIDGRGFIKGTNQLYQDKVKVLKRFSSKGKILMPGDITVLTGDALVTCLNLGKVELYKSEMNGEEKEEKKPSKKSKKKRE